MISVHLLPTPPKGNRVEDEVTQATRETVVFEGRGVNLDLLAFVAVKTCTHAPEVLMFDGWPVDNTYQVRLKWVDGVDTVQGVLALEEQANRLLVVQTQVVGASHPVNALVSLRAWLRTKQGRAAEIAAAVVGLVLTAIQAWWWFFV